MMYKVGVFPGKFSPPHRGHINAIFQAATQCETLYVVVSHHAILELELYHNTKTKPITMNEKVRWLSIELAEFDHIKVVSLDETNIPAYPYGWEHWSKLLKETVPEHIDVIYGGEPNYKDEGYTKYFPDAVYEIYDTSRTEYPISATEVRNNPFKYWDYILGNAREHFVKRVLISGTESCGKSTLTQVLSKIFFTSYAREEGRYYSTKYFGGNESIFKTSDFEEICWEHRKVEDQAIRTANRICFIDTDATVSQYYCNLYMGEMNERVEHFVDPARYDVVFLMTPDVKWVPDGFRWNSETEKRFKLHEELKQMYIDRGFGDKIIEISGNYNQRLNKAIELSKQLIS